MKFYKKQPKTTNDKSLATFFTFSAMIQTQTSSIPQSTVLDLSHQGHPKLLHYQVKKSKENHRAHAVNPHHPTKVDTLF